MVMKNRVLALLVAFLALALTGCNEKEGITFVKNPDRAGEALTPPEWVTIARNDIQSGLSMSLFKASCKLLYRDANWFIGCKPKDEQSPFMLYSVRQGNQSDENFIVTAISVPAQQYIHQNLLLRQINIADTHPAAPKLERLQQDFDALTGS